MTGGSQARLERRQRAWRWAWLLDSPLCVATWITVTLGAWSLQRVGESLSRASELRAEIDVELARLAADTVLMAQPVGRGDAEDEAVRSARVGDVVVAVERRGAEFVVTGTLPDGRACEFAADVLAGGAPDELGEAVADTVPLLDPVQLRTAARAEELRAFRRDGGVALMHMESGTNLLDFVLEAGCLTRFDAELVEVPGHLWIEPEVEPLVVSLARDITVVVRGNLYLGRSLRVCGPGRLVFAVTGTATARPFADRDGNGRRSAGDRGATRPAPDDERPGPLEGGGNVYFGLDPAIEQLHCDAAVLAAGFVHCQAARIVLAGTFATPNDPVWLRPVGRLVTTGERRFRPGRECVPGYAPVGHPRPGLLRPLAAADSERRGLYLGTLPR